MYYNHKLIPGFEKFVFKDIQSLLKKFPSLDKVWKEVNEFRLIKGHKELSKQKHKLVEYNEVIFHKPVSVVPIAVFGYRKIVKEVAKRYGLPYFVSAKKFYESLEIK